MSDAVERVEKAVMEISVCGVTVDGVRMLCCDERVKGLPEYWPPEDCDCHNYARYVRDIVLEEAAKVAEAFPARAHGNLATAPYAAAEQAGDEIAAAIRKLGGRISETDSEFLAWAKDRYGSLTGPERDRLFALATRAGFALEAENERLRAEVERLRAGGCARDQTTTQYCAEAARLAAENERLRTALEWYGEQARFCRLIHSVGDARLKTLDDDGGLRARTALQDESDE